MNNIIACKSMRVLLTGLLFTLTLVRGGVCQNLPPEVKADPSISQLVPLIVHSGSNDVIFWSTRQRTGANVPFHQPGKIYAFEPEGLMSTYYATMQWRTPSYLVPLEDKITYEAGDDDGNAESVYTGNEDLTATVIGKPSNVMADILIQHVAFFQGFVKGKKQTFFVLAEMQNVAPGDVAANSRSRPVEVDIYAFSGGSNPSLLESIPPGFESFDSFTTKYNYCDAEYAMLATLPIVPSPLTQLRDIEALAKPNLKKQVCKN